jgi:DNA-directed RNA polymerase sigma subunit (sigma70/sigma32)
MEYMIDRKYMTHQRYPLEELLETLTPLEHAAMRVKFCFRTWSPEKLENMRRFGTEPEERRRQIEAKARKKLRWHTRAKLLEELAATPDIHPDTQAFVDWIKADGIHD